MHLSSDHVRYVIQQPKILDFLGFFGGLAVVIFVLGKMMVACLPCCKKRYVKSLIELLFQVQDVSKISNIKKVNYTDKMVNAPTDPYKKKGTITSSPINPRKVFPGFGTPAAQVHPMTSSD